MNKYKYPVTGYRVVYGGAFNKIIEESPEVRRELFIAYDDVDITYLYDVILGKPGVRVYLVYGDGRQQRIKLHWHPFKTKWGDIRSLHDFIAWYLNLPEEKVPEEYKNACNTLIDGTKNLSFLQRRLYWKQLKGFLMKDIVGPLEEIIISDSRPEVNT